MTDYTELKRLAGAIQGEGSTVEMLIRWAAFESACKPDLIMAMIDELECPFRLARHSKRLVEALRAEVAGLRTGYEAYERVNAELKAECEALRKHQPSTEVIWCACGDGYPANSYGAGFMDANNGVCANCDAAIGKGDRP